MCVMNLALINTTPGVPGHPFSPPVGFDGGDREYRLLLRSRLGYLDYSQRIACCANLHRKRITEFTGPYSKEAQIILDQYCKFEDKQKHTKTAL